MWKQILIAAAPLLAYACWLCWRVWRGRAPQRMPDLAPGARGYRHMLLECGMVGERALLAAQALAACPVGAFYDDEVSQLLGLQARGEWALHFAALGMPGQEEDE